MTSNGEEPLYWSEFSLEIEVSADTLNRVVYYNSSVLDGIIPLKG